MLSSVTCRTCVGLLLCFGTRSAATVYCYCYHGNALIGSCACVGLSAPNRSKLYNKYNIDSSKIENTGHSISQ